jgi:hypothetical protein
MGGDTCLKRRKLPTYQNLEGPISKKSIVILTNVFVNLPTVTVTTR